MPHAVVDGLEVVEVEEEDADVPALVPRGAVERVGDPIGEEGSVREPGEVVLEGPSLELRLERQPVGDVTERDDEAADDVVREEVAAGALDRA